MVKMVIIVEIVIMVEMLIMVKMVIMVTMVIMVVMVSNSYLPNMMIFLLYTGNSAVITFPTSREHKNIAQLSTRSAWSSKSS